MKDKIIRLKNRIFKREKKLMKTTFRLPEVCMIAAATIVMGIIGGCLFTYIAMSSDFAKTRQEINVNKDLEKISSIYDFINENYYKDIDHDELINAAIRGMIASLGDPYATFMDKAEKQAFDERMQGEYYGVGVELLDDSNGNVVISGVFEDTPAKNAGMQAGDIITYINNISTVGMNSSDVATAIKGSNINNFTIKVTRMGVERTFNLTKKKVVLESVTSLLLEKSNKKIGYIRISLFANNTYDQFRTALTNLEKQDIDSLIIDVRNNSGGYLHITTDILSMFFPKGTTLYQLESKSNISKNLDKTEEHRTYPVVILENVGSASASEILTAAFKENSNSIVVGRTSYGKGTVQQTQDINSNAMIKFTIQKWLTPKGNWIEGTGIKPTIDVSFDNDYMSNPTMENDDQLQRAIDEAIK